MSVKLLNPKNAEMSINGEKFCGAEDATIELSSASKKHKTHTEHPFDYKWAGSERILLRNLNWLKGLTDDCPLDRGEKPKRHGYHWRTHLQQIEFWFEPKVFEKPAFVVDWESILKLGDNLHGFLGHMEGVLWRRAMVSDMKNNKAEDMQ